MRHFAGDQVASDEAVVSPAHFGCFPRNGLRRCTAWATLFWVSRTPIPHPAALSRKMIPACSKAGWMRKRVETEHTAADGEWLLFGLFWPLTIAQAHSRAAAI